jgi:LPS O-antigen subunit length determinant protein (WzzB/FepE family)
MNTEYLFEEIEKPISLLDYYLNVYKPGLFGIIKKYTIGLPELIISSIRGERLDKVSKSKSETIELTKDQDEVRKIIGENLSLEVNEKDGDLTLTSRFHQAYLSAQVAQKAQKLLQDYVTQFKVEKATAQMLFIKERYEEKKEEFEESQTNLATFRDGNKNISSAIMLTQEERLQNEYQLAFDVYSELAKQMEQSLIKVKEDTPVFSVIDEVIVPIENSKPNRKLILFVWIFLGGILGIGIVFSRSFVANVKKRWEEIS